MIIILKKDGQIVTDDGNPVEGVKLDNAAAILADPKDGDTIVYDATAGMWVAGTGGGSFVPDITNPQDGDTLVYDASEEKWVNGSGSGSGGGYLKVTATETDTEYILDKTYAEINTALANGYHVCLVSSGTSGANQSGIFETYYDDRGGSYGVVVGNDPSQGVIYTANSADDYPSREF